MFSVFLKLRDIFTYVTSEADSVVGKPVNANPIKKIWKPR